METDRFTLCMAAGRRWNTVQRQHLRADEVDDVLDEVRSLLRARGRDSTQWEVGSSAEPLDLVELLLERGLVWDKDPYAVALLELLKDERGSCESASGQEKRNWRQTTRSLSR